jgi:hypothetical protein
MGDKVLGGPSYVGDQPLSQKKQRLGLCFCWPGTGHAQCVTCVQMKKKKKKKERKMASYFFQLETEREALVFFKQKLEQTV